MVYISAPSCRIGYNKYDITSFSCRKQHPLIFIVGKYGFGRCSLHTVTKYTPGTAHSENIPQKYHTPRIRGTAVVKNLSAVIVRIKHYIIALRRIFTHTDIFSCLAYNIVNYSHISPFKKRPQKTCSLYFITLF